MRISTARVSKLSKHLDRLEFQSMNPDAFRFVDVVKNGLSVDATIAPGDVS